MRDPPYKSRNSSSHRKLWLSLASWDKESFAAFAELCVENSARGHYPGRRGTGKSKAVLEVYSAWYGARRTVQVQYLRISKSSHNSFQASKNVAVGSKQFYAPISSSWYGYSVSLNAATHRSCLRRIPLPI